MKFDRLRIAGFKSFVEATELVIEPGLTGIVGPNGCGKSNLVEAIRWVMGETSYKNMRGSGMDDVIFSGSAHRPSRNFAEVLMVIDNKTRKAPAQFNDHDTLEISRRIERQAGSNYRVNSKEVRARDVQILFADASTGSRSPAMVRQGMIGNLVNAKPEARRSLLEEAAGISGLHSRRHEAEIRLRGAETNITRLDDVIGQLESQVQSLKRQAKQAERYRRIADDLRKAEALLAHLKYATLLEQIANVQKLLDQQHVLVADYTKNTAEKSKERAIVAHKLPSLRNNEAETAAALQRLIIEQETLDKEEKQARQRSSQLKILIEQIERDHKRESDLIVDIDQSLSALIDESVHISDTQQSVKDQEAQANDKLISVQSELKLLEDALSDLINDLAQKKAKKVAAERYARDLKEKVEKLENQLERVSTELNDLEDKDSNTAELDKLKNLIVQTQDNIANARERSSLADEDLSKARVIESELREPLKINEAKVQRLQAEIDTLTSVLNVADESDWPPIVRKINVKKGLEAAIGAVFGEELSAPDDCTAPMHWDGFAAVEEDQSLPDGIESLLTYVEAPTVLHRRLQQTGLVERHQGKILQKQLKPGQRLVSTRGDLWRWDGYTAAADAPTVTAQRLQQRNKLDELKEELKHALDERSAAEKALIDSSNKVTSASNEAKSQRHAWQQLLDQLAKDQSKLRELEKSASAQLTRISLLKQNKQNFSSDLEEVRVESRKANEAFSALGDFLEDEQLIDIKREEVAQLRSKFGEYKSTLDVLKRENAARTNRLQQIEKELLRWKDRQKNGASQLRELTQRKESAIEEFENLQGVPEKLMTKRQTLTRQIAKSEDLHKNARDDVVRAEHALSEADRADRQAEADLAGAREEQVRIEERFEASQNRMSEMRKVCLDQFDTDPTKLLDLTDYSASDSLPEMSKVEKDRDRLLTDRERLGAVNLRASLELEEISGQLESLTNERQDLESAIHKLRQAINQLNTEGKQRLMEAFDVVNQHFQDLFKVLFGGGDAEMQLTESDDPLAAGLEIVARPPGKKPQTLSLLSGGEQALTGLAMIFAVFLTNPAPICVLDEVDAPLDDANVERFCDLLVQMAGSTETKFMVVTHHPTTMSRMNRLYGITMAEKGVSQIVSVDLATAETYRDVG